MRKLMLLALVFVMSASNAIVTINGCPIVKGGTCRNWNFNNQSMSELKMLSMDVSGSSFSGTVLAGSNASNTNFSNTVFKTSSLNGMTLNGANFTGAVLCDTFAYRAKGLNLSGATVYNFTLPSGVVTTTVGVTVCPK